MAIDAFEMALVHRVFQDELNNVPELVNAATSGDTRRAKVVSDHLANIVALLHHHHGAEDDLLWPKLRMRIPVRAAAVARMQDEHHAITAAMDRVDGARLRWAAKRDHDRAAELVAGVEELSAQVSAHLCDEETHIVPLINAHITIGEWHEFLARGAAILNAKNIRFVLAFAGFVLQDVPADERRRFLDGVPAGPRILLRLLGPWAFNSYRAKVYGGALSRE